MSDPMNRFDSLWRKKNQSEPGTDLVNPSISEDIKIFLCNLAFRPRGQNPRRIDDLWTKNWRFRTRWKIYLLSWQISEIEIMNRVDGQWCCSLAQNVMALYAIYHNIMCQHIVLNIFILRMMPPKNSIIDTVYSKN